MSKTSGPWVKWYAGDFLNGIVDFTAEQIAVYTVVLMRIYDNEGPIPDDVEAIARRCRMRPTSVAKVLDFLVDAGKVIRRDGVLSNKRCEISLESRAKLVQNLTKSANKRWNNSDEKPQETAKQAMQMHDSGDANASAMHLHRARTRSQNLEERKKETPKPPAPPAPVERPAWALVGEKVLQVSRLNTIPRPMTTGIVATWLAQWSEETILAGVKAVAESPSYRPDTVRGLKYFEPAIAEAHESADRELFAMAYQNRAMGTEATWRDRVAYWRAGLIRWPIYAWGNRPGLPHCLVPEYLVVELNLLDRSTWPVREPSDNRTSPPPPGAPASMKADWLAKWGDKHADAGIAAPGYELPHLLAFAAGPIVVEPENPEVIH